MLDAAIGTLGDSAAILMAVFVFLATTPLAFWAMSTMRVRGAVKRRAAGIRDEGSSGGGSRSLRHSSMRAAQRLLEYTTKHYSASGEDDNMKVLRRRLMQAGIYDPRAVGYFFVIRTALAVALAFLVFVGMPMVTSKGGSFFWLLVGLGGIIGYLGPEPLCRPAHQQTPRRASLRLPGLHGPARRVRGLRPEHGGVARPGRARARRLLSVAERQHPHGERSRSAPAAP